ncbi:MAG: Trans-aconitate 2-methyltransferase [uncultured Nocardioidaceae bacterium]|uniref:Trans-aconitate 2-methyltransferase n=1 Tax=uncultured Nocardioidaceae bacterium TaxID=253824 RepID=A0A6J4MET9_9ACTN|nr:MAG: Trans-aconitate 2-methyltransferase [uncultured Nocardioidaceae bacterium]
MSQHVWDPERYLAFSDERTRPFLDLVGRIGAVQPLRVVDLGCGPGNLTSLLADRWPSAEVSGLDSSAEMVSRAQAEGGSRVRFELADLREWRAADPVDVLVSNATLQWVPGHLDLLPRLVQQVAPQGWFAFQVPGNFAQPSHVVLHELAAEAPYAQHVADVARPSSHEPQTYLEALAGLGCQVDVWETTYLHVLTGPDPVFTWISGTGARPTLQSLPDSVRPQFEEEYKRRLREAYPAGPHGTVLPFRRIFAVARPA